MSQESPNPEKTTEEINLEIDEQIKQIQIKSKTLEQEIYGIDGIGGCAQCELSGEGCFRHSSDVSWLRKVHAEIEKLQGSKIATQEDLREFFDSLRGNLGSESEDNNIPIK